MRRVIGSLKRRGRLLSDARALPLGQRLRRAFAAGPQPTSRQLLMSRLRRDDDGVEYFDMNGTRIYFRPADSPTDSPAADEALYRGTLQVLEEAYLRDPGFFSPQVQIRRGDVVFDLGGNLGTSALLFARLARPRGRVISFEPAFADLLERNLRENGASSVTVVPMAVGDRCGEADFAVTAEGVDSRIDPGGRGGRRQSVPLITLDEFCRNRGIDRVDFIKMDIEGAEEPALRGGEHTIRRHRPRLSMASYHRDAGFGGDPQHPKLVRLLTEWGYNLQEVGRRHIFAW